MFIVDKISNKNVLLEHIHVFNESISCRIFPNLGASIQTLIFNKIDIIKGIHFSEDGLLSYKKMYQSAILFPFVGRIPNGKYNYNNESYQLNINEHKRTNALHGLLYDKVFSIDSLTASVSEAEIKLSYQSNGKLKGFPFKFKFQITYLISNKGIKVSFKISNKDTNTFPFGCGWHPYFLSNNLASSTLSFSSNKKVISNEELIPIGLTKNKEASSFKLKNNYFDDTFILQKNKINYKTNNYKLQITVNKNDNNFLQVYTPLDRKSVAIEPLSCVPNAFNNKNGLLELHPNKNYKWNLNLEIKTYE